MLWFIWVGGDSLLCFVEKVMLVFEWLVNDE